MKIEIELKPNKIIRNQDSIESLSLDLSVTKNLFSTTQYEKSWLVV